MLRYIRCHADWFAPNGTHGGIMLLYEKETSKILEACINVFNELGCGFLEPVYQEALAIEFGYLGIPFKREEKLEITYRGKNFAKSTMRTLSAMIL